METLTDFVRVDLRLNKRYCTGRSGPQTLRRQKSQKSGFLFWLVSVALSLIVDGKHQCLASLSEHKCSIFINFVPKQVSQWCSR